MIVLMMQTKEQFVGKLADLLESCKTAFVLCAPAQDGDVWVLGRLVHHTLLPCR